MQINLVIEPKNAVAIIALSVKENIAAHPFIKALPERDRLFVIEAVGTERFFNDRTVRLIPLPSNPQQKILLLGLGGKKEYNHRKAALAVRRALLFAKDHGLARIALFCEDFYPAQPSEHAVRMIAENVLMADFTFNTYKEKPKEGWPKIDKVSIVAKASEATRRSLREGLIVGEAVNRCRMLANTPGGMMTPAKLAEAAKKEARGKLRVSVLNRAEMKRLGMGGILGVAQGSKEEPRFIIMEYRNAPLNHAPVVFVGKGVTFDTGGLNLKPDSGIYEMHMDMSGGAAVINAVSAAARLGLPINIVGLVPAVENMPSGSSYRPGDILKTISGKTIEVLNTDAEGRIILADALAYAHRYKPRLIADIATLTGAAHVALGNYSSALFSNRENLEALGKKVGEVSGDLAWPLPLWDEYMDEIVGTFGDVANDGKTRYGGAIKGAMFLKQFVGDYPWIHLDIAPTMTTIEGQYLAKGASGVGVRFLVELAKQYAEKRKSRA